MIMAMIMVRLIRPDIWVATMREKQATFPSLLNS
jgi:hypothetical protein